MAITKLNSLAIPDDTIVEADLSYPLTNFSSTGIDDNATSTAITINADGDTGVGIATPQEKLHVYTTADSRVEVESTTGLAAFKATNNQGSYAWYVDSSADKFHLYDFTDASNRLTLDGNGNVGIGTTSPSTYDSRSNNLVVGDSGDAGITIFSGATSNAYLQFAPSGDTGLNNGLIDYDNNNDSMAFVTGGSERMAIDASGNVGIGTASPVDKLHVFSGAAGGSAHSYSQLVVENSTHNAIQLLSPDSSEQALWFGDASSSTAGGVTYYHPDNLMTFRTSGTERLRIDTYGGLNIKSVAGTQAATFGGANLVNGITALPSSAGTPFVVGRDTGTTRSAWFGGHVNINAGYGLSFDGGSNYLDDYEEGTFTLTDNGSGIGTISSQLGKIYTKVGRLVTVNCEFTVPTNSNTNAAVFAGLPFNTSNLNSFRGIGVAATTGQNLVAYTTNNANTIYFYSDTFGTITYANLSGKAVNFSLTYQAA